jgi:hypothetical protein
MTKPLSEGASDRVSASFYRISLLKMQMSSIMLANPASRDLRVESSAKYRRQAEIWLEDWQEELKITTTKIPLNTERGMTVLEAWGNLQYHHAALLASDLAPTEGDDLLGTLDHIVRS